MAKSASQPSGVMMPEEPERVEVYIDGASRGNPGPAGVGVVFFNERLETLRELSKPLGETTNNVAEYLALVYACLEALHAGYRRLSVKTDSELLARQINGQYKVRDARLKLFHELALYLRRTLIDYQIEHVPRERNARADQLASRAAQSVSVAPAP